MEFGRIVVLRNGSTGATYELDLGEHSIGSSIDCELRLKLQNGNLLPKHAFVKVSRNGVAIITNKSAHAPVIINGNPCLKFEVLKHGDIFEIIGKQFQYFNEILKDEPEDSELFIREKKKLLKLSRKSVMPLVKTYTTYKTRSKRTRSFMPARRSSVKSRRNNLSAICLNVDDTAAKDQTTPIDNDQMSLPIQDNTVHSSASLDASPNFSRAESDSWSECNISTSITESDHASEEIVDNEARLSKNASILHDSQNNSGNGFPIPNDVQLDMPEFDPSSYVTVRPPKRRGRDVSDFPSMTPPHKKSIPTRRKSMIIIDEDDTCPISISTSCADNLSETDSKLSINTNNLTCESSTSYELSDLVLSQSLSLKEVQTSLDENASKDSTDAQKTKSTTSVNIFDETTQEANQNFESTTPPCFSCPTSDQNAPESRTSFDETTQRAIQNGNSLEETKEVSALNSTTKISEMNDLTIEVLSPVKPLKPNGNDQAYVRRSLRNSAFTKTALATSLKESTAVPLKWENDCDDPQSNSPFKNTNSALEDTEIDVVNFTAVSEPRSCLKVSSVQNESPLRKSSDREPIFTSTPFVKARVTEHSATELSKPVKRRSSLRLSVCKGDRPSQPKRVRSLSLPQLPKVENKKLLSRSVFQPTDPKDLSLKHQIISKRKPEYSCETTLEMLDVVKDETPKSHIKPVRRLSKVNASVYNPVVEDITPVTPGVLQETDYMGDLFKTPTNTAGLFESIRECAIRSRKRGRESHAVLFPEKNNSTRAINQEQPSPQPTSPKPALRKRQNKSPLNRLSSFEGVKRLMKTPAKSPNNDLTNVPNLRKLMSPRARRSHKNDLTNVPNLRKLMSPRVRHGPKNDLTSVTGIGSLFDTSGVDLLHNNSDDGYSKDLFTRLSGKFPIKSYTSKGKSLSPAKRVRNEQTGNSRKSMGATPSCSPRVYQWVEEQLKTNTEQSSFGGDGDSAKSPPNLEQTIPVTRSASSKNRAQDKSRQKTNGDKAKSNLNLDLQPESVLPGDSGDIDSTANPTSLDVLVHDEIKSTENEFEKNNSTRNSKRKSRTPLKALVNENVIQTPENTVSKVRTRTSTRKISASDNAIGQMVIVPQNDGVKETPSEIRRSKIATVTTAEAINISESSGDKLEVQVNVAQELSLGEKNSPAVRRSTRRRKILSDKDLDMVMETASSVPLVEDPNAVKTTKLKVSSLTKCVKTTKKLTRSQFPLPDVEAKFYEKSKPIRESTPDASKAKTEKLKTRLNSRTENKYAVLQTPTDANDSDTDKIKKTTLKNTDTPSGKSTRTRVGARKLRQEPEDLKNTTSFSSDSNSQSIVSNEKDTGTNQEGTNDTHENLEKPVTATGRKTERSVKAKKTARGKNKVIDAEVQPTTPNIQLEILEKSEVVSEKVPTKPEGSSSPEIVKTRSRRGNKLPSVPTIIEKNNLDASGAEKDTPQKVETLIERPRRTRARKLINNTENEKKAVSVPSSDATPNPKPTATKPEESTHTDVKATKEKESSSRPKGRKRVIERSASPLENDAKRVTRRCGKVDSSVEPEGAADTTPDKSVPEQANEKANTRKQPLASRRRNKKVHFDEPKVQTTEVPNQDAEAKKTSFVETGSDDCPAEPEPVKKKRGQSKLKNLLEKTKEKQAAHPSTILDDNSAKRRVSGLAYRTRSRSKKV
ncbi:microtubule-associated protein futsch isoform X1 [Dendroctonus ponderosae]|uniref:microtubule-associated protein futsch isoform X1 n=1 Tax=Dendroctonus ponderosae TaxID=77166 RepID=UPI0020354877|nr:microtubule-associated protein futsch isoform X1 [Dendroctonus ponderosae]KAH1012761.1 hypothetical protein HUJ05_011860 [Dendroctonus ponderosae]